jgi:hemoglobin
MMSEDKQTQEQQSQENKLPYYLLGGEQGVKNLCREFYQAMDKLPEAKEVRAMHGDSLSNIEEKLFEYLSGWLGGPSLYFEKYDTVCLTSPHKVYQIDEQARDQWLRCMDVALEKVAANSELKTMLEKPMFEVANMLKNS